ncbi:prepilin-type N-terminal cleavage/methylation domain-containing protein [Prochlorococcus sp. MIT 1303]|uniref:prepilin-type N-terminal cleavage/methylation domain-containing protein n=1 Tax=Prochlorococcus sp. MIT 1303 TaxID=1723647 RepID=UPI0007B38EFE|nr:prepilin-type N-terminal cleavage/methylation domain-containing protein [Prochlorococcus sp. MIT 1303]KZR62075.1 Fimbrial protein precursor [Prochlorococcus sp. MIT 1303]
MTALQSYLASPKIKKVLNRRPGEEGFSLIELVVVVAVLAILAAVAIPNFTSLSDDARLNSAKQTLVNQYKECEYNAARSGTASHVEVSGDADAVINGVTFSGMASTAVTDDAADNCLTATLAAAKVISGGKTCNIAINLATGAKSDSVDDAVPAGSTWPDTMDDCD